MPPGRVQVPLSPGRARPPAALRNRRLTRPGPPRPVRRCPGPAPHRLAAGGSGPRRWPRRRPGRAGLTASDRVSDSDRASRPAEVRRHGEFRGQVVLSHGCARRGRVGDANVLSLMIFDDDRRLNHFDFCDISLSSGHNTFGGSMRNFNSPE